MPLKTRWSPNGCRRTASPRSTTTPEAGALSLLAAHADWSVDPRKRWITRARRHAAGWSLGAPRPVGEVGRLFADLLTEAGGAPVALGADFPIGLPRAYAARLAAPDFQSFLRGLAADGAFFRVCDMLAEVDAARPFYPRIGRAGMTRAAHAAALGLGNPAALCRACDRATAERPAGAPLFWTLGANQSGKAAIAAWRDLLVPAATARLPVRLWPFEGAFRTLLAPGGIALAETYPAEALRHLGLRLRGSKRRQADRAALAPALRAAITRLHAVPDAALGRMIEAGFGADAAGEDRLDSVLGVLCVIGVLDGHRPDTAPADPWVQRWEGWVLGQTSLPLVAPDARDAPLQAAVAWPP